MERTGIFLAVLMFSSLGLAQESMRPALPANVLGPQLIVWSEFQKPQPVPQPLPPPERADQSSSQTASSQTASIQIESSQIGQGPASQAQPGADAQNQSQPTAQVFSGTIVKDSGKYMLKAVDGAAYQLDDQDKAGRYEGKQVRISGSLDASGGLVHIGTIELIS